MEKKQHILADNNITKLLIRLSLPATFGMFAMAFYNIADAIFVGRGVGPLGIGGVSIVFPYQMLVLAMGQLLGIGGASIVSRSLGANNKEKAEKTLGSVYLMVLLFGILLAVLGSIFIDLILKAFGATNTILPYSKDYMQVILLGTPFFLFLVSSNSIIRSEGRAKIAMGTMFVSALMNIILDPIFIFVLKMGVRGAAIATVISQFLAAVYIIFFFSSKSSSLNFSLKLLKFDLTILKEIFAIGVSAFARHSAGSVLVIIINNTLKSISGDISIAVFGIIHRLLRFTIMPIIGIAQGFQPIVGFNYGAGNYRNILKTISRGILLATCLSFSGFAVLFIFPYQLMSIFTADQNLIHHGVTALRLIVLALPAVGVQIIGATTFQALGKALPAFLLSLSRQILFLVPMILILPRLWGINGVWISFPAADIFALMVTFPLLYYQVSFFKKIVVSELRNNNV